MALNCITENIQLTAGRKYSPRGSHVYQPWIKICSPVSCLQRPSFYVEYCILGSESV